MLKSAEMTAAPLAMDTSATANRPRFPRRSRHKSRQNITRPSRLEQARIAKLAAKEPRSRAERQSPPTQAQSAATLSSNSLAYRTRSAPKTVPANSPIQIKLPHQKSPTQIVRQEKSHPPSRSYPPAPSSTQLPNGARSRSPPMSPL